MISLASRTTPKPHRLTKCGSGGILQTLDGLQKVTMSRISIDVTPQEHQRLKAMAALQGKSIKEFVLDNTLRAADVDPALRELEAILDERVKRTKERGSSTKSVADVFEQARNEADSVDDA